MFFNKEYKEKLDKVYDELYDTFSVSLFGLVVDYWKKPYSSNNDKKSRLATLREDNEKLQKDVSNLSTKYSLLKKLILQTNNKIRFISRKSYEESPDLFKGYGVFDRDGEELTLLKGYKEPKGRQDDRCDCCDDDD